MKLHQLHIDKEIIEDWSVDIYHSRLYHSLEECKEGCFDEEIFEIADVLWRNSEITNENIEDDDTAELEYDDVNHLKKLYEEKNPAALALIENAREWLFASKKFCGDGTMSWHVCTFEVVEPK